MMHCLTHTSRVSTAPARVCTPNPSPAKSPPWRRELLERPGFPSSPPSSHELVFHSIMSHAAFRNITATIGRSYLSLPSLLPANTDQQHAAWIYVFTILEAALISHPPSSKKVRLLRGKRASRFWSRITTLPGIVRLFAWTQCTVHVQVLTAYHCHEPARSHTGPCQSHSDRANVEPQLLHIRARWTEPHFTQSLIHNCFELTCIEVLSVTGQEDFCIVFCHVVQAEECGQDVSLWLFFFFRWLP